MYPGIAVACPKIAFIKYWGNRNHALRIPSNSSISMNLDGLYTRTQVSFIPGLVGDRLVLDGVEAGGVALERVRALLERVRQLSGIRLYADVESANNFPSGTGIASSASAFAALSMAASCAAGIKLNEREISRLARSASGSACRSVPGGFVEWQAGVDDQTSYAFSIAPPEYWRLVDCVAIVSRAHKLTGSYKGHALADSSPLQAARLKSAPVRLKDCRQAILERDFEALAEVAELDSNLMHAVIMTSTPRLHYWQPSTLEIMHAVTTWRKSGLPVFYTVDAGPNVHVLTTSEFASKISEQLSSLSSVLEVMSARPGGPARCENSLTKAPTEIGNVD